MAQKPIHNPSITLPLFKASRRAQANMGGVGGSTLAR